uniref:Lateral signaling target protein 2 n=1 Tax=Globodera pallida TaxID=36090 RepID=A0A183CTP3_GLOPA
SADFNHHLDGDDSSGRRECASQDGREQSTQHDDLRRHDAASETLRRAGLRRQARHAQTHLRGTVGTAQNLAHLHPIGQHNRDHGVQLQHAFVSENASFCSRLLWREQSGVAVVEQQQHGASVEEVLKPSVAGGGRAKHNNTNNKAVNDNDETEQQQQLVPMNGQDGTELGLVSK